MIRLDNNSFFNGEPLLYSQLNETLDWLDSNTIYITDKINEFLIELNVLLTSELMDTIDDIELNNNSYYIWGSESFVKLTHEENNNLLEVNLTLTTNKINEIVDSINDILYINNYLGIKDD